MEPEWKNKRLQMFILVVWTVFIESLVNADVYVRTRNDSEPITYFLDLMADFGPEVPDKGISGYLHPVKPLNACVPVAPPPDNTSVWIALIARDNCTFVEKVRNVQPWYSAAIVFNRKDNNKIETMHGDGSGIHIPSVFIGWSDGRLLQTNYCYNCTSLAASVGNYIVTVDNKEYTYNPYLLWPFAVVVGTCFILMLSFMVFKWCRDMRKKRKSRLSTKHLKKIPTKKFKKGDEYDVCAICLDDYNEGDKLRLLPCSHVYHCSCIDPWLTKNKRSCPICKRKVIPGMDNDSDSETENDGEAVSERTPLLGGGSSGNNNNGGTSQRRNNNNGEPGRRGNNNNRTDFENSGLPSPVQPQRVHHVQEATETDTDSSSDSEYGAVGGVQGAKGGASESEATDHRRVSPHSTLKTEIVSEIHDKTESACKRPSSRAKPVTNEIVSKKETVARDMAKKDTVAKGVAKNGSVARKEVVATGEDNGAYGEESDSSDTMLVTDTSNSEVYFPDSNKKDDKKVSHVV